ILMNLHLVGQPIEFTSNPDLALWTVLSVHIWKNFGTTMIYWLAALQTVPDEYIEAAQIDGAGVWSILRYIRLPILLPFALIIIVLTAQENIHAFGIVQAMTQGGPYFKSQVLEVFIYQTAFQPQSGGVPRLGFASAAGCFFGTATLIFALIQLWVVRKVGEMRSEVQAAGGDRP
ncbi:MAG TPA: sugar ABC transporter permease, partial [Microlunatus sp.]